MKFGKINERQDDQILKLVKRFYDHALELVSKAVDESIVEADKFVKDYILSNKQTSKFSVHESLSEKFSWFITYKNTRHDKVFFSSQQFKIIFTYSVDLYTKGNYVSDEHNHEKIITIYDDPIMKEFKIFGELLNKYISYTKINPTDTFDKSEYDSRRNNLIQQKDKLLKTVKENSKEFLFHELVHFHDDKFVFPFSKQRGYQFKIDDVKKKINNYVKTIKDESPEFKKKVERWTNDSILQLYFNDNTEYNAHFLHSFYKLLTDLQTIDNPKTMFSSFQTFKDHFFANYFTGPNQNLSETNKKKVIKRLYELYQLLLDSKLLDIGK